VVSIHFHTTAVTMWSRVQAVNKLSLRKIAAIFSSMACEFKSTMNEASTTLAQGKAKFKILEAGAVREFEVVISPLGDQFAVTDTKGNILLEPQEYPPSGPVEVQGTIFELSGGALPDDKFTANLVASEGDNGNLRKMINVQTNKEMNDNNSTIIDLYHNLNTDFGLKLSTASRLTDVSRLEKQSAQERISGKHDEVSTSLYGFVSYHPSVKRYV